MSESQSHTNGSAFPMAVLIKGSAHKIWLAGLGAFSRAEKEGNRVFNQLASVGGELEKKARQQVSGPIEAAERGWNEARISAGDAWDHLELAFDRRVTKMLNSLQIPTHRDVAELSRRVADLQKAVDRHNRARASVDPTARAKSGSSRRKTATKRASPARKKVVARKTSTAAVRKKKATAGKGVG